MLATPVSVSHADQHEGSNQWFHWVSPRVLSVDFMKSKNHRPFAAHVFLAHISAHTSKSIFNLKYTLTFIPDLIPGLIEPQGSIKQPPFNCG